PDGPMGRSRCERRAVAWRRPQRPRDVRAPGLPARTGAVVLLTQTTGCSLRKEISHGPTRAREEGSPGTGKARGPVRPVACAIAPAALGSPRDPDGRTG